MKPCKDCAASGRPLTRPAPHPGPRCATDWRAERKRRKVVAHGAHVERTYGLTAEEYKALYEFQGGRCYVCTVATGAARMLAVEHDHRVAAYVCGHDPQQGCKRCVTGLACGPCNKDVLGRLGRNPETYRRIADALTNPPARRLFGGRG